MNHHLLSFFTSVLGLALTNILHRELLSEVISKYDGDYCISICELVLDDTIGRYPLVKKNQLSDF